MRRSSRARTLAAAVVGLLASAVSAQSAAAPTAHDRRPAVVCADAAREGQEARDAQRLVFATERLAACSARSCPAIVREECARWLADVERLVPRVSFRVRVGDRDRSDATVSVDEASSVPADGRLVRLDPGKHVVVATTPEGLRAALTFVASAGESARVVEIVMPEPERPPPEPSAGPAKPPAPRSAGDARAPSSPVLPITVMVAGVVVAGVGVGVGVAGLSQHATLRDNACAGGCTEDDASRARSTLVVADIMIPVGVLLAAGGLIWWLVR